MKHYRSQTTHFLTEGRTNLADCVRISFAHAIDSGIQTLVMFTATGDGLELACTKYLPSAQYSHLKVVGVSFPYGVMPSAALRVSEDRMKLFEQFKIPLVRASSPLEELGIPQRTGANLVRRTLEMFSGGMALCVRAILVACDGGFVRPGEHLISMCADTSILAKAAPTSSLFSIFAIRQIICKPLIHNISKGEILAAEINVDAFIKARKRARSTSVPPQPQLPGNLGGK